MPKIKTYTVRVSEHTRLKVRAKSIVNARKRAWEMIAGKHTYGWTKQDFLRNARVEKV